MQSKFSADSLPDLSGRVYLVTGGNAGIGKATVVGLASRGARVWMGTRNETKALTAIDEIKAQLPSANIQFLKINLSSLASVVSAAKELRRRETILHGLVNNAGVMGVPFALTADGYDIQLQTNYIAHWLLTHYLLPLLTANSAAGVTCRIVNVTSDGHAAFPPKSGIEFADINLGTKSAMMRYGQTKLANVLHAKELHRRYGPKNAAHVSQRHIIVAAVHPGHIDT
ncbi:uncharacterized protein N7459_003299 [Penicillium hispanicum]|uniref:uncharacterized protein n=1 Tax=Penicillium hispanicum TaxID=1080232 RepID=UPI00253F8DAB|nr:uncharacterized protein N7459_003299 [Penicillium hispanicum]KAJ5587534.1 hypothetical protein N7459_003299 [Penicillium hispanicum]